MRIRLAWSLVPLAVIRAEPLEVPVRVGDNDNWAMVGLPASVVVPLPRGQFPGPDGLGILGRPSQVEVLSRWPEDGSVRSALVHFQPKSESGGQHLFGAAPEIPPASPVKVSELPSEVMVETGPMRFSVGKQSGGIVGRVWLDGHVLLAAEEGGAEPRRVVVEERGPVRAVVRVESAGVVARVHAYAGVPAVMIAASRARKRPDGIRLGLRWKLSASRWGMAATAADFEGEQPATLAPDADGVAAELVSPRGVVRRTLLRFDRAESVGGNGAGSR